MMWEHKLKHEGDMFTTRKKQKQKDGRCHAGDWSVLSRGSHYGSKGWCISRGAHDTTVLTGGRGWGQTPLSPVPTSPDMGITAEHEQEGVGGSGEEGGRTGGREKADEKKLNMLGQGYVSQEHCSTKGKLKKRKENKEARIILLHEVMRRKKNNSRLLFEQPFCWATKVSGTWLDNSSRPAEWLLASSPAVFSSENKHAPAQLVEWVLTWLTVSRFRPSHLTSFKYLHFILSTYSWPSDPAPLSYRMKNRHSVQMKMRRMPNNQHCMMKKGMGSMMVLGSYLSTIRNSVTVIAATSHACWPNFLWNFLMGTFQRALLWKPPGTGRMLSVTVATLSNPRCISNPSTSRSVWYFTQRLTVKCWIFARRTWSLDDLSCWSLCQLTCLLWTWWPTSSQHDLSTLQRASCAVTQSFKCPRYMFSGENKRCVSHKVWYNSQSSTALISCYFLTHPEHLASFLLQVSGLETATGPLTPPQHRLVLSTWAEWSLVFFILLILCLWCKLSSVSEGS